MGDQAAFISAGDYHHHIGLNTWQSLRRQPAAAGHDRPLPHGDPLSRPRAARRRAAPGRRGRDPDHRRVRPRRQRGDLPERPGPERRRALPRPARGGVAARPRRRRRDDEHPARPRRAARGGTVSDSWSQWLHASAGTAATRRALAEMLALPRADPRSRARERFDRPARHRPRRRLFDGRSASALSGSGRPGASPSADVRRICSIRGGGDRRLVLSPGRGSCAAAATDVVSSRTLPSTSIDELDARRRVVEAVGDRKRSSWASSSRVLSPLVADRLPCFEPLDSLIIQSQATLGRRGTSHRCAKPADRVKARLRAINDRRGATRCTTSAPRTWSRWAERAGFSEVTLKPFYALDAGRGRERVRTRTRRRAAKPLVPSLAEASDSVLDETDGHGPRSAPRAGT